jgi:TMEM175 potassium channel family protein
MGTSRLEAFSDGVLAIIITIMVLEIKVPHGGDVEALRPLVPVLLGYALSFVYVGIYWNNHHHMLQLVKHVNGLILWANLHLLFWLSLVPFVTRWMAESGYARGPVALYGVVLIGAALSYTILLRTLIRSQGRDSPLAAAVGRDRKGMVSLLAYAIAIGMAFVLPWVSLLLYIGVAILWFVPDPRIERRIHSDS